MFHLVRLGSVPAALLYLSLGSVAWGFAAGALRTRAVALLAIALVVELVVGFEFKRIYVIHYFAGPAPRTVEVFMESLFFSDFLIAAVVAGLGWLGWRWQGRRIMLRT
jgi:hypothetical protein